jgi:hypothetical protein
MDMVGYSRLIGLDDVETLICLRALQKEVIGPAIEEHGGRIVQTGGERSLSWVARGRNTTSRPTGTKQLFSIHAIFLQPRDSGAFSHELPTALPLMPSQRLCHGLQRHCRRDSGRVGSGALTAPDARLQPSRFGAA